MARASVFSQLCNRTVVNGVPDWYNAKKMPAKTVWTLILVGAAATVAYYTYQTIWAYLQYQTVTQISEVRALKMPFPNITVCHSGRFNKSFIEENIVLPPTESIPSGYDSRSIKTVFIRYFAALSYQVVQFAPDVKHYLQKVYEYNFDTKTNKNALNILEFINQSSFRCEDSLFECRFTAKRFDCCAHIRLVLSDYGVCYHFQLRNRDPTDAGQAMQLIAGLSAGFAVLSSVQKNQMTVVNPGDDVGLRVHLSSYLEPDDYKAILLLPGRSAIIRLNPKRKIVDPTIRKCLTQPIPLPHHEAYTVGLCQNECVYNFSTNACGCAPAGYLAQVPSWLVCSPQQMLDCLLPKLRDARGNRQSSLGQCYRNQCPKYCDNWDYQPAVTYNDKQPGTRLDKNVTSLADTSNAESNWYATGITIYFGDLHYLQYEQQLLTTLEEFICSLGGQWGLWTGISIAGMIQCCYIIFCSWSERDEEDTNFVSRREVPIATVQGTILQ